MRRILITGASGKSGSVFIERLGRQPVLPDDQFRVVIRQPAQGDQIHAQLPEAELVQGDLTDLAFLDRITRDVDILFHIAGIHWSLPLVEAAAAHGVQRMVLVHTTGIYSKYKAAGEGYRRIEDRIYDICTRQQINLTILRPTMIYGKPSDRNVIQFIKMVDRLPVMPIVSGARFDLQPVHYEDLGIAYYQVLSKLQETAGEDFILSGRAPIQLREMLTVIGENLGKKVRFFSVPFPIAYAGAVAVYGLSGGKIDYREKVQRLCEPRAYSHEKASQVFGYAPRTFQQGIVDELCAYRNGN